MLKARLGKEVVLRVENEVGVLDQIARTVAEKGVDIQAVSAWVEGSIAVVRLVTEDNRRVADALRSKNYDPREADVVLTARIDRYTNAPTSVSGQERAEFNRVTLTVWVRYYNRVEDKEMFQRTFNSFDDYDPIQGGLEQEEEAARNALENIADDIFTAATSNW